MREWWMQLAERERLILGGGAVVLAVLVFFLGVWEPLYKGLADSQRDLRSSRELVSYLVDIRPQLGNRASQGPRPAAGRSLLSIVDTAAKQSGLAKSINRIQPDGELTVRVWIDETPLNEILRWVQTLHQGHGVKVSNLNIERGEANGTATARMSLQRR